MIEEIVTACRFLERSKIILSPTDTIWGIEGDACNPDVVEKIISLKKRPRAKGFICLMKDWKMVSFYIPNISNSAREFFERSSAPITIIFDNPKGIASNLIGADNTLGIRIPRDYFCQQLLEKFNKPIVSTSANISGCSAPKKFSDITDEIIKGVDYVVRWKINKVSGAPSKIITFSKTGRVHILRN